MSTVIFLGAGASAAEGAPLQGMLFHQYFSERQAARGYVFSEMDTQLATFFWSFFSIDVHRDNLATVVFPTFEEALGVLDLAEQRNEAFKGFDLENIANNSVRISLIRQHLVMAMAKVINDSLERSKGVHVKLIDTLQQNSLIQTTSFVTTNYDILVDNALIPLRSTASAISLDYGVEFVNTGDWELPTDPRIMLFKIHGSLNWLFCRTCNNLTITPKQKGIMRLLEDLNSARCVSCGSLHAPIIVPPTFYKNMSNVFLSLIWNKTEQVLRAADSVVFCGYSFPDADMHIKYLLKRAQTNRSTAQKYFLVNEHKGKDKKIAAAEMNRFKRFLGQNVFDTECSFEKFADNPALVI